MTFSNALKSALLGLAVLGLTVPAMADQLADIKAKGKIETATDMHYAPFDMLNNGTYEGMTKDLFDGVAKEIGAEPVYQDIPWTAELPGLEVKKFDIVIAPVTITPERLERYAFTLPIADATVALVRAAANTELKNPEDSVMPHSVDFHAATGPGGGADFTQTAPGDSSMVTFKALKPGIYVYHCATPSVAHHITSGMYGLILVEPEGGLPHVDREFYVMQGELYTVEPFGTQGEMEMDYDKLISERPEYFLFNGAVGSLTETHPLYANAGETVRIYFGVGGPNYTSSFHVIGEVFDTVYPFGSVTSPPLTNVQTITVPPGGATIVDFKIDRGGHYVLVDHALSRVERGLAGYLIVDGPENDDIMHSGPAKQDPAQ